MEIVGGSGSVSLGRVELFAPELGQRFQIGDKLVLGLFFLFLDGLQRFEGKGLVSECLPVLLQPVVEKRARRGHKIEGVLPGLEVRGVIQEIPAVFGIRHPEDAAEDFSLLVFAFERFSSVHSSLKCTERR